MTLIMGGNALAMFLMVGMVGLYKRKKRSLKGIVVPLAPCIVFFGITLYMYFTTMTGPPFGFD